MAIVNPQVPEVADKNYFGYSKPIETPNFHSEAALGFAGAGHIIEKAAKGYDTYLEEGAKTDTRNALEPLRDEYTAQLTQANDSIKYAGAGQPQPEQVGTQSTARTTPDSLNILPPQTNQPEDIKNLSSNLDVLKNARASGKLTETDYYARATTMLKDIRAKYPAAYRDNIDAEASKVMGVNPANALVRSLIGDINSYNTSEQHEINATLDILRKSGYPRSEVAYQNVLSRKWSVVDAKNYLAPFQQREYQRGQWREGASDTQLGHAVQVLTAKANANETANSVIADVLHGTTYLAGNKTWAQLNDTAIQMLSGKIKFTSDDAIKQAQLMDAYIAMAGKKIDDEFNKVGSGGYSYSGILQQEEVKKIKEASLARLKDARDLFFAGKGDLATAAMVETKARVDDAKYSAVTNKDTGPAATMVAAIRELAGDTIATDVSLNNYRTKLNATWNSLLADHQQRMASSDPRIQTTFKSAVDQAVGLLGPGEDKFVFPKVWRRLQDYVDGDDFSIANKGRIKTEVREQMVKNVFGPGNAGFINALAPDTVVQTADGKYVTKTGAHTAFQGFTSPKVLDSIAELSSQHKAWYIDWVVTTAERDLLNKDVGKLREVPLSQLKEIYGLELNYNNKTHELELQDQNGSNLLRQDGRASLTGGKSFTLEQTRGGIQRAIKSGLSQSQYLNIQDSLNRVNKVVSSLHNVGETLRNDGERFSLETLLDATGRGDLADNAKTVNDTTGFDILSIKGLPTELTTPVRQAREKELKRREDIKKSYGP